LIAASRKANVLGFTGEVTLKRGRSASTRTRFYTAWRGTRGWGSAHVGDVHVHHLVLGIGLTLVAGGLASGLQPPELLLAIVFGEERRSSSTSSRCPPSRRLSIGRARSDSRPTPTSRRSFVGLAILATFVLPIDTTGDRLGRRFGDGLIALPASSS
jgi:hypothetical protein